MYATVRRYEGIDESRSEELARRIGESLMPRLGELPGFGGYSRRCAMDTRTEARGCAAEYAEGHGGRGDRPTTQHEAGGER